MAGLNSVEGPDTLARFWAAQKDIYAVALAELHAGRKRSHWMWFIFPQLRGLGRSAMAHHCGIADLNEAGRYLAHPVLGPRLVACAETVAQHAGISAEAILGSVDASKLRSCATLFAAVDDAPVVFARLLDIFFNATPCARTQARLGLDRTGDRG